MTWCLGGVGRTTWGDWLKGCGLVSRFSPKWPDFHTAPGAGDFPRLVVCERMRSRRWKWRSSDWLTDQLLFLLHLLILFFLSSFHCGVHKRQTLTIKFYQWVHLFDFYWCRLLNYFSFILLYRPSSGHRLHGLCRKLTKTKSLQICRTPTTGIMR